MDAALSWAGAAQASLTLQDTAGALQSPFCGGTPGLVARMSYVQIDSISALGGSVPRDRDEAADSSMRRQ